MIVELCGWRGHLNDRLASGSGIGSLCLFMSSTTSAHLRRESR